MMSASVLLLSVLFFVLGCVLLLRNELRASRRRRRDRVYSESQGEFIETLQRVSTPAEANTLLHRHLERSLPGTQVVVLHRNTGEDRLEPATNVADDPDLDAALEGAKPRACLAIRLGRANVRDPFARPLIACGVCGKLDGAANCQPLMVGGEAIGSVLVRHERVLGPVDQRRVLESAIQVAPVLANLRNLELVQLHAATDGLTGLPNARAVYETLDRMVAQTNRTLNPLSTIVVEVDGLDDINEASGREKGDQVLAAVAAVLRECVRYSDFAGRAEGDSFLVLLPDTGPEGAEKAAEKIRAAIASVGVRDLDRAVTASLGVSSLPIHASDPEGLLRIADRALQIARARGRNRVELAPVPGISEGGTLVALPTLRANVHEDG
jgi:diguanylate cyclase (GGDEF)-like protein